MEVDFNILRKKLIKDYNEVLKALNGAICEDIDMSRVIIPVMDINVKLCAINLTFYTRSPAMWKLELLIKSCQETQGCVNGKWVPARPENFKPPLCPLWSRLRYAWQVVCGRAETFVWPEGQ